MRHAPRTQIDDVRVAGALCPLIGSHRLSRTHSSLSSSRNISPRMDLLTHRLLGGDCLSQAPINHHHKSPFVGPHAGCSPWRLSTHVRVIREVDMTLAVTPYLTGSQGDFLVINAMVGKGAGLLHKWYRISIYILYDHLEVLLLFCDSE